MIRLKIILLISTFTLAFLQTGNAVELYPTPLQNQFSHNIFHLSGGEFDEVNKLENNKSEFKTSEHKRVSIGKTILYSALLPGLGEYYVGSRNKAKFFFAAEALTWVSFLSFRTYGSWKKNDLIRFASDYAGANLESKDDQFLDYVGFYDDINQYNTAGRVTDPDRPYLPDTPENHWHWQSNDDRSSYRDLKNSSREAYRRGDFMIGVAIINRIVSIIDAVRDAKRSKTRLSNSFTKKKKIKYRFALEPLNSNRMLNVTLYTPF